MGNHSRTYWLVVILLLVVTAVGLAGFKVLLLDYHLTDVFPRTRYALSYEVTLDGGGDSVRVATFLPASDAHQEITDQHDESPAFHFSESAERGNRIGTWSSGSAGDGQRIRYTLGVLGTTVRYQLDPELAVPDDYSDTLRTFLQPEEAIQVDHADIKNTLRQIGADVGSIASRLGRIYKFVDGLASRSFKGTTDALTTLRLREASCNGKSRLFVALARAAGLPARLVGGLILEPGSKRTSHQWVEVYVAGHWVPFCPTNHHFAEIPAHYLILYRGDEVLFRHTANINFDYRFTTTSEDIPSPKVRTSFELLNAWALFERLNLPFSLLATVLMLPVGALVVVLFRNVVGVPTFGTFLPALVAAAANETGAIWGVAGLLLVIAAVATVRAALQGLGLLHSPTLAILLAAVTITMLGTSMAAEHFGLTALARVSLFPIAVLALSAEKFYLTLTEDGVAPAASGLLGTLIVIGACYLVMSSLALRLALIVFPELLLLVIAANTYLGRWTGMRLSEYVRFRGILAPVAP